MPQLKDHELVINEKVNYLLKNQILVRNYRGLTQRQQKVELSHQIFELAEVLGEFLSSQHKGKITLNGWEIEPIYYLEEDCWMNPEKEYDVHYYQIKDSQGGMIFPSDSSEMSQLYHFLRNHQQ